MNGDRHLFVQGAIIAVLLAMVAGRVIGPVELPRRPLDKRTATAPTPRTWTPMPRD